MFSTKTSKHALKNENIMLQFFLKDNVKINENIKRAENYSQGSSLFVISVTLKLFAFYKKYQL